MVIQFLRRPDLFDDAVIHDYDPISQGHGFHLVMRHIHGGCIHRLMHLLDFGAHLHAQLGVQVGKRFVKQEDFGVAHNGAAHGNTLALPARKRLGLALQQRRDVQNACGFLHAAINFRLREFPKHQAEGHIVVNAHVRIKRVILEHHGNVTIPRWDVIHQCAANGDIARGDFLQPSNHAERGGFAAARRPDQDDEFVVGDFKVNAFDCLNAAFIGLDDLAKRYLSHVCSTLGRAGGQAGDVIIHEEGVHDHWR